MTPVPSVWVLDAATYEAVGHLEEPVMVGQLQDHWEIWVPK